MRFLVHPGPVQRPRIIATPATYGGDIRLALAAGADLLDTLVAALTDCGIVSAAIALVSGSFERVEYLTGGPDPTGQRVATYGAPTVLSGPVALLAGNAILGVTASGENFMHCHAVLADAAGVVHGGHLPPGRSKLGPEGAVAFVTAVRGAAFRVAFDPETNFALFGPTTQATA